MNKQTHIHSAKSWQHDERPRPVRYGRTCSFSWKHLHPSLASNIVSPEGECDNKKKLHSSDTSLPQATLTGVQKCLWIRSVLSASWRWTLSVDVTGKSEPEWTGTETEWERPHGNWRKNNTQHESWGGAAACHRGHWADTECLWWDSIPWRGGFLGQMKRSRARMCFSLTCTSQNNTFSSPCCPSCSPLASNGQHIKHFVFQIFSWVDRTSTCS